MLVPAPAAAARNGSPIANRRRTAIAVWQRRAKVRGERHRQTLACFVEGAGAPSLAREPGVVHVRVNDRTRRVRKPAAQIDEVQAVVGVEPDVRDKKLEAGRREAHSRRLKCGVAFNARGGLRGRAP